MYSAEYLQDQPIKRLKHLAREFCLPNYSRITRANRYHWEQLIISVFEQTKLRRKLVRACTASQYQRSGSGFAAFSAEANLLTIATRIEQNETRLYEVQERSAIAEADAEAATLDLWFELLEATESAAEPSLVEFFGVFALALIATVEFTVGTAAVALIAARMGYRVAVGILSREPEPAAALAVTTA